MTIYLNVDTERTDTLEITDIPSGYLADDTSNSSIVEIISSNSSVQLQASAAQNGVYVELLETPENSHSKIFACSAFKPEYEGSVAFQPDASSVVRSLKVDDMLLGIQK